jgi:hypothetical protein
MNFVFIPINIYELILNGQGVRLQRSQAVFEEWHIWSQLVLVINDREVDKNLKSCGIKNVDQQHDVNYSG